MTTRVYRLSATCDWWEPPPCEKCDARACLIVDGETLCASCGLDAADVDDILAAHTCTTPSEALVGVTLDEFARFLEWANDCAA